MKKIIILILVLAASSAAFIVFSRQQKQEERQLTFSGTVEATTVALSFNVGGTVVQRVFDEGEKVHSGDVVARLDAVELKKEAAGRVAEEKAALAVVADLQAGSRKEEIAQGEAALRRGRSEEEKARKDLARGEELFRREVLPQKDLDALKNASINAAAGVNELSERLALLKKGARPDNLRYARAKSDAAKAARELAEKRAGDAVLKSPIAGVVLAKHAEPGEHLMPGAPVLTIGKLDEVWLKGYIPEDEIGKIKLNSAVTVSFDSFRGRTFAGRLSFISPLSEFTPKNVQTKKERVKLVYRVKVTLANPSGELKPGMPGDAEIALK